MGSRFISGLYRENQRHLSPKKRLEVVERQWTRGESQHSFPWQATFNVCRELQGAGSVGGPATRKTRSAALRKTRSAQGQASRRIRTGFSFNNP